MCLLCSTSGLSPGNEPCRSFGTPRIFKAMKSDEKHTNETKCHMCMLPSHSLCTTQQAAVAVPHPAVVRKNCAASMPTDSSSMIPNIAAVAVRSKQQITIAACRSMDSMDRAALHCADKYSTQGKSHKRPRSTDDYHLQPDASTTIR